MRTLLIAAALYAGAAAISLTATAVLWHYAPQTQRPLVWVMPGADVPTWGLRIPCPGVYGGEHLCVVMRP